MPSSGESRDAGVKPPGKCGPHIFRHARAVEMLRASVPQKVIGDMLGHRSTESTAPYLKLATEDLRAIALDVPGSEVLVMTPWPDPERLLIARYSRGPWACASKNRRTYYNQVLYSFSRTSPRAPHRTRPYCAGRPVAAWSDR
ncbi:tyrosine-type recombinase/integrase [Sphingobium sp. DEHP117]|uniref:tyrosine-type recombinase/integrase n=1 Tax=Sphingobium sp. DEHP117 TaxID=2993436 RepID=UPI0027D4DFC6|nr:tyrosine-type recombinase/integrase [Sphingobium sp. DEHP117]MDQ4420191.1 tyrosine-type recombinase/integrase [Sphingobium sp. DEHP117]